MHELQRQNNVASSNLVNSIVSDHGYARWDKSFVQINKSAHIPILSKMEGEAKDTIVIVPLVKDGNEMVNAYLEAHLTKDVKINLRTAGEYRKLSFKKVSGKINSPEKFAIRFMSLTRDVYGTNNFKITDKRLFSNSLNEKDSIQSIKIKLNEEVTGLQMVTLCVDIIVTTFTGEWYCGTQNNPMCIPICDHCGIYCYPLTTTSERRDCESWWEESGGGTTGDGPVGGDGNGSGGGTGGSQPGNDDPCDGGGLIINGVLPPSDCDGEEGPGWLPEIPEFVDPLEGKTLAPDDFYVDHYWEDDSYDNNSYINPIVSNPSYDQEGYRKKGPVYKYYGGNVQNYTNDNGGNYAIFKKHSGEEIKFPGATITDYGALEGKGATTSFGGIHADLSFDLADLQHEYGHYLQAQYFGSYTYNTSIVPASLWSMTFFPSTHKSFWTETHANNLAIIFFGNNSDIALSPTRFPL